MTVVYFDASALLKLLVEEEGSTLASRLWDGADAVISHPQADAEIASVIAESVRAEKLSAAQAQEVFATWDRYRQGIRWLRTPIDPQQVFDLAARYSLSGSDLVHLCSALIFKDEDAAMAVWDPDLAAAANAEGLAVVPRKT